MNPDENEPLPPGLQSHLLEGDRQEAPRALLRAARVTLRGQVRSRTSGLSNWSRAYPTDNDDSESAVISQSACDLRRRWHAIGRRDENWPDG